MMKQTAIKYIFVSMVILLFSVPAGEASEGADYRVLRRDEKGMVIEVDIPAYRFEVGEDKEKSCRRIVIPGYLNRSENGGPALPEKLIRLPLPGIGSLSVNTVFLEKKVDSGITLCPPPPPSDPGREIGKVFDSRHPGADTNPRLEKLRQIKKKIRETAPPREYSVGDRSAAAAAIVRAGLPYWQRDSQYVNLLVRPVRYRPGSGEVEFYPRLRVEIEYGTPRRTAPGPRRADYGHQFELASSQAFKTGVTADGIYQIGYNRLQTAGFDLGSDPRNLSVFFLGEEISIYVEGEDDGAWNPGDFLCFYGRANTGFYSQTNIYWLAVGDSAGERMEAIDSPPAGRPTRQNQFLDFSDLEENHIYFPDMPNGEGKDHWFWDYAGVAFAAGTDFRIEDLSSLDKTAPFTGYFFGLTSFNEIDPDHHTRVSLNGRPIGDFYWDGQVSYTFQTDLDRSFFNEGTNTISVEEIGDTGTPFDFIYIDSYRIAYRREYAASGDRLGFSARFKGDYRITGFSGADCILYDITNPAHPRRIIGQTETIGPENNLLFRKWDGRERTYLARTATSLPEASVWSDQTSDLTTPRRVDYLAVSHPDFSAAVEPLLQYRQNQGLLSAGFEIQEVYDTFSYGNLDPRAIKGFLEYTYYYWTQPPPAYVLLVGDGNYDYKNYLGTGLSNYMPPYLFQSLFMETASDNWFACIVGDDNVPEMHIGRLCVTSFSETSDLVAKIIAYENQSSGIPWQDDILMVADTSDPQAGDFPADSDWLIANHMSLSYTVDKAYIPDLGVAGTRTAIINAINAGRLLVNYLGHGTVDRWSGDNVFNNSSLSQLTNIGLLPLLVTPTCLNGYWCDVNDQCLAEVMSNAAEKGAIGSVSPTGLSLNQVAVRLTAFFFDELLTSSPKTVGPALTAAKARLAGVTPFLDHLDLYSLFGDPALTLK